MLRFDLLDFVCIIVNLLCFFLLAKFFIFGMVTKIIDQRQQLLDDQKDQAAKVRADADALKAQYEKELAGVDETSRQMLAQAKEKGMAEYNRIMDRAQSDAEAMMVNARKSVDMEREKRMDDLNEEITRLAMDAAGRILSKQAGADTDDALYDDFLAKAGEVE